MATICEQTFGKPFSALTPDERKTFHKYMAKVSYYRHHEANKTKLRESKRNRKADVLQAIGITACQVCGYDRYLGALDFHHPNADDKDAIVLTLSFDAAIAEARKCQVLCANCHREAHANEHGDTKKSSGRPRTLDPLLDKFLTAAGITRD